MSDGGLVEEGLGWFVAVVGAVAIEGVLLVDGEFADLGPELGGEGEEVEWLRKC